MGSAIGSKPYDTFSKRSAGSGSDGGNVEDFSRRLDKVEGDVSELKPQVATIVGLIPHLATKSDVADLKAELKADVADLKAELKADAADLKAELKADVADLKAELKADAATLKGELKADITAVKIELAVIPFLATKADLATMKTTMIKWMIATVLTATTAAFSIAKFVH